MIHHVSLPASDPWRVARALAELLEGTIYPFADRHFLVVAGDAAGTALEVLADDTVMAPGEGDRQVRLVRASAAKGPHASHVMLSVPVTAEEVLALGAREGWRCRRFWRASEGVRQFELIELWLENRTLLEVLTPELVAPYQAYMQPSTLAASEPVSWRFDQKL